MRSNAAVTAERATLRKIISAFQRIVEYIVCPFASSVVEAKWCFSEPAREFL
jgi:hypothetical protein